MLRQKHVRETVRSFGLELVDLSSESTAYRAVVKAADGATREFKVNKADGDRDLLTASYMRRFANEHGKVSFPGRPAIPTVLQTAMAEAAEAARAAQLTAQERIAANPQPKDTPDMPTLTLAKNPPLDAPASAFKPPKPEKKTRTAITHIQFAKLANTVAAMDTTVYDDIDSLAAHLTVELGFPVMHNPVRDALAMHGKTTKVQQQRIDAKAKKKPQAVLAAAIAHLYTKLGEDLPADLKEML